MVRTMFDSAGIKVQIFAWATRASPNIPSRG
nr:MAG TPA: hypothetical protein [Caudoviricetes sp.]